MLDGWTSAVERLWPGMGVTVQGRRALPNAVIYTLRSPDGRSRLVAYSVDNGRPLTASLEGHGRYADGRVLADEGLVQDFDTIVASLRAAPR